MRAATAFSVMALVGSTLAAPAPPVVTNVVTEYATVIHTITMTEGYGAPTEAPAAPAKPAVTLAYSNVPVAPKPTKEAPKPTSTKEAPKPIATTIEVYQPPPQPTAEVPEPSPEPEQPAAPEREYMGVVNEWRGKMGMKPLKWSKTLEAISSKCVEAGNGQMAHLTNLPSNGQVLAPGENSREGFVNVYVGGWLCEIDTLPGLNGICKTMSKGWNYMNQRGHAEILSDKRHKTIACAWSKGIWSCDLSFEDLE